ncbi:MAG: PspC domain-containing protein [Candidatus Levybacteria bacterium]|nr:PspC domain-containing protein [Candidatus Levybacteria bacterium]
MNTLERPKEGKMIAGVAAALANYFHINVIFIRLIWVLLFLPGGFPGFIPYVILWILIPSEKNSSDLVKMK